MTAIAERAAVDERDLLVWLDDEVDAARAHADAAAERAHALGELRSFALRLATRQKRRRLTLPQLDQGPFDPGERDELDALLQRVADTDPDRRTEP